MLRRHCGGGGATAVLVRYHGGHGGAAVVMAVPRRSHCGLAQPAVSAEVLNMLKVSAVPPRRSAMLIVFRGTTAINDVTSAEPRRSRPSEIAEDCRRFQQCDIAPLRP